MQHISQVVTPMMKNPSSETYKPSKRETPGDPNCPRCKGIGYLRLDVEWGHPSFGQLVPCECWLEERVQSAKAALDKLSNVLPDESEITLDSLIDRSDTTAAMIAAARKFSNGETGILTLWGGVGLGKTAALFALVNTANAKDLGSGYYVRFVDLMNIIRRGYADNTSDTLYQRLIKIKVLAIDEMDKARETDWAQEFRTMFLDDRYRFARNGIAQTVIAMNNSPATLPDHLYDRLRFGERAEGGFRIVNVTGQSARPAGL